MAEMGAKISDELLRKPGYREIFEGSEVDIVNREGLILGRALLLKRCPSKTTTDLLPYAMNELDASGNKKREEYVHIWSYERWLVEWIRHSYYPTGHRSCTEVNFYIHTRINHDSKYELCFGTRFAPPEDNNKYIFVEEEGVLVTPSSRYPKPTVKALNKVHKVYGGEVIMYSYNQNDTRKNCEKYGVYPRILSFLNTNASFEESIAEYVETVDSKDFMILAGKSKVKHSRVFQVDMAKGILCLKKDNTNKRARRTA